MIVDWSQARFSVWAVAYLPKVEGGYEAVGLDLSAVEMTFGINQIPEATLHVAAGFEAFSGDDSLLHQIINQLRMVVPVQVWIAAVERDTSTGTHIVDWPKRPNGSPKPFMAFEGNIVNVGFSKDRAGSARFTLSVAHWLSDLNYSTSVSRASHVTNPSHYYNPAGLYMAGTGVIKNFVGTTMGAWAFNERVILDDFWGYRAGPQADFLGLYGYLLKLCEQDILQVRELGILPNRGKNVEALSALRRFEPFNGYRYGRPFAMRLDDLFTANEISRVIAQDVQTETLDATASVTLWDKLVNSYAASYMAAVIPMVDRALVVPLQPGLRRVWQTIVGEDYDSFQDYTTLIRPLRGVGVFTGIASGAGGLPAQPGAAAESLPSIGGYFENTSLPGGMVRFFTGPAWLSRVQSTDLHGFRAANPLGLTGSAMYPGVGPPPLTRTPAAAQARAAPILSGFAQSLYINEALVGRTRTIASRPRFDIAPGSSVRVITAETAARRGLAVESQESLYGTVSRVVVGFDAENCKAYSNLLLTHVRTEAENADNATSIAAHPLWAYVWRGAPLVDDPVFGSPYPPNPHPPPLYEV